jgi:hypothetical protein
MQNIAIQETGAHVLYLCIGFIQYPDPPDPKYKDIGYLKAVTKIGNIVDSINTTFTDSASNVNKVVNKPNLVIFITIVILSIILISLYYFYDEFNTIVDEIIKFIKSVLYPKVSEE